MEPVSISFSDGTQIIIGSPPIPIPETRSDDEESETRDEKPYPPPRLVKDADEDGGDAA